MTEKHPLVLIVDDEPDMCWALEFLLKKNGARSMRASSAEEALSLMKPERFQMVFLDAKLPDMEGLDLAGRLKVIDPAIRITMVSGYYYRDDEAIQTAISGELICGFIGKPFVHEEILQALENVYSI